MKSSGPLVSNPAAQNLRYVLVTAAYNEEGYIEPLIKAMVAQTARPLRWVIVSDGSTDHTDDIVRKYAKAYEFIELYRIREDHTRNFAAQVHAINTGFGRLTGTDYDFIGNVDADVTFEAGYFEDLLGEFAKDPALGLAGGSIFEERNGEFRARPLNSHSSVAHAAQLFRRECFEALGGGYIALPHGGPDWYAGVQTRMNGWAVRSIPELKMFHHRATGGAAGWWRSSFRQGRMDYSLGTHPVFEIFRLIRRVQSRPYLLYAAVRLSGFVSSYLRGEKRIVPQEFVKFLRSEETDRLRRLFHGHPGVAAPAGPGGRRGTQP
jgi:glycosyltransferase involved in cell wall biosynthesis